MTEQTESAGRRAAPITADEMRTLQKLAARAQRMFFDAGVERDWLDWLLDFETVHETVGLKLEELLCADDGNFSHDAGGIYRHLNRESRKLGGCFLPRYALPEDARTPPYPGDEAVLAAAFDPLVPLGAPGDRVRAHKPGLDPSECAHEWERGNAVDYVGRCVKCGADGDS